MGKLIPVTLMYESDAVSVREALLTLKNRQKFVAVADYLRLAGVRPTYEDEKVGWTELNDISIKQVDTYEFLLDLPEPRPFPEVNLDATTKATIKDLFK